MFERLSNSWTLVKASARVLQADKELLVFPAISGLALIVVSVSFFLPLAFLGSSFSALGDGAGILATLGLFAFYFVQYFVIIFFNSALVGAALIRLDGGNPTIKDGLNIARSRIGQIFGYAAIAATVGMLLRAAKERSGFLSGLVLSLVGLAWNLATFLVVPVLVTRNLGPIDAIKESSAILKRTWGEQVAGNVGLNFVFGLLYVGWTILLIPVIMIAASAAQPLLLVPVIIVFALGYLTLGLVNAALAGIYSAAVYRYATTGQVGLFDSRLLEDAFTRR